MLIDIIKIREEIFTSDDFVLEEVRKIQTLFELKKVIRYNHERLHVIQTESVAEHVYGMLCLSDYFMLLEDIKEEWDQAKIKMMIQYHDIDEIETGDVIGYQKTAKDIANERSMAELVINKLPDHVQSLIREALDEYEAGETIEARFAKAIDKLEPSVHLYNDNGKAILAVNKTTKDEHDRIKYPYVKDFPIIKRFVDVLTAEFEKENFYFREKSID